MGREKERESARERMHAGERVLEKALWLLLLYVFPSPGPALCKLGLARSSVCSAEVFTLVLRPSLSFSHHHFGLLFPLLPT